MKPCALSELNLLQLLLCIAGSMTVLAKGLAKTPSDQQQQQQVEEVVEETSETNFEVGWTAGFDRCRGTCAIYSESDEENDINKRRRSADDDDNDDQMQQGSVEYEYEVVEEKIKNADAHEYWNGFAEGYEYCTQKCQEFSEDEDEAHQQLEPKLNQEEDIFSQEETDSDEIGISQSSSRH